MDNNRKSKIKSFDNIYSESNKKTTSRDKIELITEFTNKMKELIHQSNFIIKELENEV